MKVGDRVQCTCAPRCARSWPAGHGPCVQGRITGFDDDDEVIVRQDCGGHSHLVNIWYGQAVRRTYPELVSMRRSGLRLAEAT